MDNVVRYQIFSDLGSFASDTKDREATLQEAIDDFQSLLNSASRIYYSNQLANSLHLFVNGEPFMTVSDAGYAISVRG